MDTGLKGKNALITGGSSGIGLGIATVLAGEGVNLAIASRNPDPQAIDKLSKTGIKCVSIKADVSREADVISMVAEAVRELGHLDIYINNAAWTWHQPITKIDTEAWNKTIDTNLSSCIWACREVCRHMIGRRSGNILIISSTSRMTIAYEEATYRISKTGLKTFMQNLAIEMAPYGIRTNMITPGHFKTRMTGSIPAEIEDKLKKVIPIHRFGNPLEVGNAAALLISDRLSGYTCGADLVIDGGLSLHPLTFMSEEEIYELNL